MKGRELYKYLVQQSQDPIIKNPVLRKSVDQERMGFYLGKKVPSQGTIEDADVRKAEDALSGSTDVMKIADLQRQGHIGHYYADGGDVPRKMYKYAGKVTQGPNKGKHKYEHFYPKKTNGSFHAWFNTKKEMNEALKKRKEESGRGLTEEELTKKYKKQLKARGYKTWGETPDNIRRSISTSVTPTAIARKKE